MRPWGMSETIITADRRDRVRVIKAINAFCRDYEREFPAAADQIHVNVRKTYDTSTRREDELVLVTLSSGLRIGPRLQGYIMGYLRGSE